MLQFKSKKAEILILREYILRILEGDIPPVENPGGYIKKNYVFAAKPYRQV
jgi:hypothetical protein